MRDEDDGGILLLDQFPQQTQNLVLDGHVQRSAWLVGNEQLGTCGEGHADTDSLAHPAAELDGIAAQQPFRIGQRNLLQGNEGSLMNLLARQLASPVCGMVDNGFQLLANAKDRVESGGRVLKDHRDTPPSDLLQVAGVHLQDVPAFEINLSLWDTGGRHRQDAQDGFHRGRFAAAGFTNQSDFLAAAHDKVNTIQNFEPSAIDREVNVQILDFD